MLLQNPLSVEDVLARDVSVRWYEGVALVQSLCRQLLEAGKAETFPGPADVLLGADGAVSILRVGERGQVVPNAARLLAATQGDDVPVQLRLLVAQATGSEPSYATLEDFSNALAFFERPDGPQVLRQLHERAAGAGMREGALPTAVEAPRARKEPEPAAGPKPARKASKPSPVFVALPVATIVAAAVWLFGFSASTAGPRPEGVADEAPAEAAPAVAGKGAEPLESGSPRKPAPAGQVSGRAPASSPATASLVPFVRNTAREPLAAPREPEALPPVPPDLVSYERIEITASPARTTAAALDGVVYSAVDRRVVPPRAVYPKLPEPSAVQTPDSRTVLELVVTSNGLVERVRMRTEPRNVHEFMLLSAAKAWRFEPATLDGWPVKFVHTVALPPQ